MANKDKLLLLAMISMLLPGAMPDAFADGVAEPEKKAKRSTAAPKTTTKELQVVKQSGDTSGS